MHSDFLEFVTPRLAFSFQVEEQLRTYTVEAHLVWPHLQSRLGHFGFLRNAHLSAVTGGKVATDRRDPDDPACSTGPAFRLECPTCLRSHSPNNPTFALLPGCWHTLCMPCHNRIASLGMPCQRRCPVCRTPFQSNERTSGHNARRRRPLTLIHYGGEGADGTVITNPEPESDNVECTVLGDHSSKVKAVVRCLKEIKQTDPDAKAIVFSSWLSVLITIAGALDQNDLSYTTLFQPRDACCPGRLAGFQYLGSVTWILLMPIQLGANGLNLTSANHVLLIDPVLSHGREAQAIARMHRIGQTRPSVVHRFLVRDSIEAALHAAHSKSKHADAFQTHVYLGNTGPPIA
ncbi:hypothetical protein P879_11301 [Paragonimus westermani]|uniref:RING-type domain-containing protein n=1 Tax=Paragonimus westermani TaxID=34504 RepID=A0A8T0D6R5_9TREM|nr:hypothetical protein P879_11301 [Paragonimus westermani]